jgi:hypothetical protein
MYGELFAIVKCRFRSMNAKCYIYNSNLRMLLRALKSYLAWISCVLTARSVVAMA